MVLRIWIRIGWRLGCVISTRAIVQNLPDDQSAKECPAELPTVVFVVIVIVIVVVMMVLIVLAIMLPILELVIVVIVVAIR